MSASPVIELEPLDSEIESEEISGGGSAPSKRSLGLEIVFSAVSDYRFGRGRARSSAEAFLYPTSEDYRSHLEWVASMCNVDEGWLREALDRARPDWDSERQRGITNVYGTQILSTPLAD